MNENQARMGDFNSSMPNVRPSNGRRSRPTRPSNANGNNNSGARFSGNLYRGEIGQPHRARGGRFNERHIPAAGT